MRFRLFNFFGLNLFGRHRPKAKPAIHAALLSDSELAEIAAFAIEAPAGRRMSEHLQRGEQASRFRGAGIDFEDLRPYQPGDDPRRIDWRVTARLRKTFVRVYGETRQAAVWVIVDRGASMRFGTRTRLKAAQAARLAALILSGATRAHEAIALSLLDGEQHINHPPRAGRAPLYSALASLRAPCPPVAESAASAWAELLGELEISLPHGSRLWIFSDFLGLSAADEILLERLAARADVRLGLIEDAQEIECPNLGRIHLIAHGTPIEVDTNAASLRRSYAEHHAAHRARLHALALRLRGHLVLARADEDLSSLATLLAEAP
ncbi:MAG: hypothetical protein B7Y40_03610 [Gammaproteobacteria bacterium 28-57-27]|nr:MAG: hypothetical protein B7Y40_03610 [Gammaproteobacteria bacterium 28-57-27]